MITRVPPGTWETLSFPSSTAAGDTAYQLQIDPRLRVRGRGGRTTDATMVSPSEGNEARRNGRQGQGLRITIPGLTHHNSESGLYGTLRIPNKLKLLPYSLATFR